jgi:hypothetical protein
MRNGILCRRQASNHAHTASTRDSVRSLNREILEPSLMLNRVKGSLAVLIGFSLLSSQAASAVTLKCSLISEPTEAQSMGSVDRFEIDEGKQAISMYRGGGDPDWTYGKNQRRCFRPEGRPLHCSRRCNWHLRWRCSRGFSSLILFQSGLSDYELDLHLER